jgi:putative transposase
MLKPHSYRSSLLQKTFKFRLYLNSDQSKKILNTLAACRYVYNKMVEKIRNQGFQTRNDLNYFLTELKESEEWLYSHHSKMLQMVSMQVEDAQKSLIRLRKNGRKVGNLKFARFSQYNTFVYNQTGFDIKGGFLHLSKIGKIKIIQHRKIPENSKTKQITITKSKSGKWHACIVVDVDTIIPKISLAKSTGIDVGIKNFAYDSEGFVTPNPLNFQKMLKPLRRAQRKISRRQIGSSNRKKALRFYHIIHERIRNRRRDFLHKLSTQYARNYDIVFVERLAKLNMVKNHKLARGIMDSGWGMFTNMLHYKTMLVEVRPKNTTTDCSRCGNRVPKTLAVRTHRCNKCGLVLDRDHNAAINILKKGLSVFGILDHIQKIVPQELREVTPVEISKRSKKQEAASHNKR